MFYLAGAGNLRQKKTKKYITSSGSSSISTQAIKTIINRLKMEQNWDSTRKNCYTIWKIFMNFFIKLDAKPTSWEDRLILFVGYLIEQGRRPQTIELCVCHQGSTY